MREREREREREGGRRDKRGGVVILRKSRKSDADRYSDPNRRGVFVALLWCEMLLPVFVMERLTRRCLISGIQMEPQSTQYLWKRAMR